MVIFELRNTNDFCITIYRLIAYILMAISWSNVKPSLDVQIYDWIYLHNVFTARKISRPKIRVIRHA